MGRTVADVMTRDVTTLSPDVTLKEMDRILLELHVSGAPVVENGKLVGIVSRSDVIRILYAEQVEAQRVSDFYTSPFPLSIPSLEHLARDSRKIADHMIERRVREIMTENPLTIEPSADLQLVAKLMSSERVHRIPVTDDGKLVGIVSSLDIVRVVGEVGLGS
jgi:CBS domain-containing protein